VPCRADAEHHVPEIGDQKPAAGMVSFLEMIAVDPDGLARAHAEAQRRGHDVQLGPAAGFEVNPHPRRPR
jgi:hypothetical protein